VQEPRGAAARELGFDSSQARNHPNHVRGSCSPSYSRWFVWILLAQAKSAKRLALNSRRGLLIRSYDPWRVAAGSRGESAQSVTHAGRAFIDSLPLKARPCRPVSSRHPPGGSGRQNADTASSMPRTGTQQVALFPANAGILRACGQPVPHCIPHCSVTDSLSTEKWRRPRTSSIGFSRHERFCHFHLGCGAGVRSQRLGHRDPDQNQHMVCRARVVAVAVVGGVIGFLFAFLRSLLP
jgi:hypothetical protein